MRNIGFITFVQWTYFIHASKDDLRAEDFLSDLDINSSPAKHSNHIHEECDCAGHELFLHKAVIDAVQIWRGLAPQEFDKPIYVWEPYLPMKDPDNISDKARIIYRGLYNNYNKQNFEHDSAIDALQNWIHKTRDAIDIGGTMLIKLDEKEVLTDLVTLSACNAVHLWNRFDSQRNGPEKHKLKEIGLDDLKGVIIKMSEFLAARADTNSTEIVIPTLLTTTTNRIAEIGGSPITAKKLSSEADMGDMIEPEDSQRPIYPDNSYDRFSKPTPPLWLALATAITLPLQFRKVKEWTGPKVGAGITWDECKLKINFDDALQLEFMDQAVHRDEFYPNVFGNEKGQIIIVQYEERVGWKFTPGIKGLFYWAADATQIRLVTVKIPSECVFVPNYEAHPGCIPSWKMYTTDDKINMISVDLCHHPDAMPVRVGTDISEFQISNSDNSESKASILANEPRWLWSNRCIGVITLPEGDPWSIKAYTTGLITTYPKQYVTQVPPECCINSNDGVTATSIYDYQTNTRQYRVRVSYKSQEKLVKPSGIWQESACYKIAQNISQHADTIQLENNSDEQSEEDESTDVSTDQLSIRQTTGSIDNEMLDSYSEAFTNSDLYTTDADPSN